MLSKYMKYTRIAHLDLCYVKIEFGACSFESTIQGLGFFRHEVSDKDSCHWVSAGNDLIRTHDATGSDDKKA